MKKNVNVRFWKWLEQWHTIKPRDQSFIGLSVQFQRIRTSARKAYRTWHVLIWTNKSPFSYCRRNSLGNWYLRTSLPSHKQSTGQTPPLMQFYRKRLSEWPEAFPVNISLQGQGTPQMYDYRQISTTPAKSHFEDYHNIWTPHLEFLQDRQENWYL